MHRETTHPSMLMSLDLDLTVAPPVVRRPEELTARGTFTNTGPHTFTLKTLSVSVPSLALTLRRASGAVVPLAPPPVPSADAIQEGVDLAPGESRTVIYEGFLPQPLEPGDYELRLRYRDGHAIVESSWVSFKSA